MVTGGAQPTEPATGGQGQDSGATQQGGAEPERAEGAGDTSGTGTEASGTGTEDVVGMEADGKAVADVEGVTEVGESIAGGEIPAAGDTTPSAEVADSS